MYLKFIELKIQDWITFEVGTPELKSVVMVFRPLNKTFKGGVKIMHQDSEMKPVSRKLTAILQHLSHNLKKLFPEKKKRRQ